MRELLFYHWTMTDNVMPFRVSNWSHDMEYSENSAFESFSLDIKGLEFGHLSNGHLYNFKFLKPLINKHLRQN